MVVQRGYKQPPSFHEERLRNVEAGYFFDVMTNGFGGMPDYRMQLAPRDRWAVVAYIRALQLSQHAATTDVPGGDPTKAQPAPAQDRCGEARINPCRHSRPATFPLSAASSSARSSSASIALLAGGIGAVMNIDQFFRSWLIGFLFCLSLSLGSLALLMLQHLSGGQWGMVGRRVFEAGTPHCCRWWRFSRCR